jgi:hypothetical protein
MLFAWQIHARTMIVKKKIKKFKKGLDKRKQKDYNN